MAKNVKVRLQHKIDSAENWGKAAGFVPLQGELIIYSDGAGGEPIPRVKIGDGKTAVDTLDFADNHDSLSDVATSGKYEDLSNKPTTQFNLDDDGVLFVEMVTLTYGTVYVSVVYGGDWYTYENIPGGITWKELLTKYDQHPSGARLWYSEEDNAIYSGSYCSLYDNYTQDEGGNEIWGQVVTPDDIVILGHEYTADGN